MKFLLLSCVLLLSVVADPSAPILPLYAETEGSAMYFFPNMRGTTASCSVTYDLEIGKEFATIQFIDTNVKVDFYAMFNEAKSYLVTSVDGNIASCQTLDMSQQPVPSPNILDSHGQYVGNALVGDEATSHWQVDVVGTDAAHPLTIRSDLYFLTSTLNEPSLPIRQVSQYWSSDDYLGFLIMDLTSTTIEKPSSQVFQPPAICFSRALGNTTRDVFPHQQETNAVVRSLLMLSQ